MTSTEHLLVCLSEECAEVQQAIAKALRFGLPNSGHEGTETNLERLNCEVNDLCAVINMLDCSGVLRKVHRESHMERKQAKVIHYMNLARETGNICD